MLTIRQLTDISREVARDFRPDLDVIGVASTSPAAQRVELLVRLRGCHPEPCDLVLNLPRSTPHGFESALRVQLRASIELHMGPNTDR